LTTRDTARRASHDGADDLGATELVLDHTGLPDDEGGRGHEAGWKFFLARIAEVVR